MSVSKVVTTPAAPPAEVRLQASIDATSELTISYDGADLATVGGQLEIECDSYQAVKISIPDFEHGGETWTVSATRKIRVEAEASWIQGPGVAYDDGVGHTDDYVPVEVTATASTEKKKKIYVKTKPRHSLPDPLMQQGE